MLPIKHARRERHSLLLLSQYDGLWIVSRYVQPRTNPVGPEFKNFVCIAKACAALLCAFSVVLIFDYIFPHSNYTCSGSSTSCFISAMQRRKLNRYYPHRKTRKILKFECRWQSLAWLLCSGQRFLFCLMNFWKRAFKIHPIKTSIINNNNPFVSLVPLDVVLIFAAAKKLKPNG